MASCFMTGATGFIGRHLLAQLVERGETVYCLVRPESLDRLGELALASGEAAERVVPVVGDLREPALGADPARIEALRGNVEHFFHVAALYDMAADSQALTLANVDGTRHAVELAEQLEAGCFHHVSSIAVSGHYRGTFTEAMLEEAEHLDDPYACSKHDAEAWVRGHCRRPFRIYRPAIVVGHSRTGEIDKIDGPYYFFPLIQRMRTALPSWLPRIGLEAGTLNLVPVDFVARALDHIAHVKDLDGRTFHLVDPDPASVGEVLDAFCRAARAPELSLHVKVPALEGRVAELVGSLERIPWLRRLSDEVLKELGVPRSALGYLEHVTEYDCSGTLAVLRGSGIAVPPLEGYAGRLWDFWELNLAPRAARNPRLARAVEGRRVLITGASAGIGRATARRVAASGGHVLLVARTRGALESLQEEIERAGGRASVHVADLSDAAACTTLVTDVLDAHGGVDILVNNAGHSIRRSLELSYDRVHDFERTMQLNYFGALRLILGFLPGMRERRSGQILNVSTIGVQTHPPRYSAYVASKAALDAFTRCAAAEVVDDGVTFTTVYMPLVRTGMIEPTELYRGMPALRPERAAGMLCDAMIRRPSRVSTWLGWTSELTQSALPGAYEAAAAMLYRLFPDSGAARGDPPAQ